jgi:hypothetical protein
MSLRNVLVVVSNQKAPMTYLSRSYPNSDKNNNGLIELYETPVFYVFIRGNDENGVLVEKRWEALRFMPYWNPDGKVYSQIGWANAGLHSLSKTKVSLYKKNYTVHNRHSDYNGAIQLKGSFLIHAGPTSIKEIGWGAAGCVEIIGNFGKFKENIRDLSGTGLTDADDAIEALVKAGKLFVQVDYAVAPQLQNSLYGEVKPN